MTAAKNREPMSVEEYLAWEEASLRKHEYLDGTVYAMAGPRNVHIETQRVSLHGNGRSFRANGTLMWTMRPGVV